MKFLTNLRVSVENVDKLLFFYGPYHDGATLRVNRQVLAGHDPSTPGLAEGLHVDPLEQVLGGIVLEDDDPAGIGSNDNIILVSSGQAEGNQRTDNAEHFNRKQGVDLASVRVRSHQL